MRMYILACVLVGSLFAEEAACGKSEVYFVGDFLWWTAENSGFSYAFEQTTDTTTFPNEGKINQIDSEWKPGFQVGVGFDTQHRGWDLFTNWTWYSNVSTQTRNVVVPPSAVGQGFYPIWPAAKTLAGGTDLGPYMDVQASWRLLLNIVDAELSKTVLNSGGVVLDLQWGVRGAWLRQKFSTEFTNPIASQAATSIPAFEFFGQDNYWGVGPLTGLQSQWEIIQGFSLLGKIASAFLYGNTDVSNLSQETISSVVHHRFTQNFNQLVPCLQMLLGLEWGSCFRSDTLYFQIQASWETHFWWNRFNVPFSLEGYASPAPAVGNAPLTTQGLTINFQLSF